MRIEHRTLVFWVVLYPYKERVIFNLNDLYQATFRVNTRSF